MSAIRYHNDTLHIVRFGSTDHKPEQGASQSWILFYRNATCFEVTIEQMNITGTAFEQEWLLHLEVRHTSGHPSNWVQHWEAFCDFILSRIQPKLEELAPAGSRSWVTLEDFIATPGYELSIHKPLSSSESDIEVHVDSGPIITSALEIRPQPLSAVSIPVPDSLAQIQAKTLEVLNHAKDFRQQPYKVRLPDGRSAFLIPAQGEVTRMPENVISNPSMLAISSYIRVHRAFDSNTEAPPEELACLLKPVAIATTTTVVPDRRGKKAEDESLINPSTDSESTTDQVYIAGLLLPYLSHARCLQDPETIAMLLSLPNPDAARRSLHETLLRTVSVMHNQDPPVVHGNINPWTILIHSSTNAAKTVVGAGDEPSTSSSAVAEADLSLQTLQPFLVGFSPGSANNLFIDQQLTGTTQADLQGLENTFGDSGWLVHELKEQSGEIPDKSHWHRASS